MSFLSRFWFAASSSELDTASHDPNIPPNTNDRKNESVVTFYKVKSGQLQVREVTLKVRKELKSVFDVTHSQECSCLKIILLALEEFLYSAREAKVNKSFHFESQRVIFRRVKTPRGEKGEGRPSVPSAPRLVDGM